jgi:hypothetical protein
MACIDDLSPQELEALEQAVQQANKAVVGAARMYDQEDQLLQQDQYESNGGMENLTNHWDSLQLLTWRYPAGHTMRGLPSLEYDVNKVGGAQSAQAGYHGPDQDGPLSHYPALAMVDQQQKWNRIAEWVNQDSAHAAEMGDLAPASSYAHDETYSLDSKVSSSNG